MDFQWIIVLAVILAMLYFLAREHLRPGIILFSALTVLIATGIISPEEALVGFSNKGMLTVFVLFFVSEGIRQTGALNLLVRYFLPKKKGLIPFLLLKMMLPIAAISAFLNNTPIVVIFAPVIKKWSEKLRLPPSKFLIPLSYATILGGMCTLIGTSTNLVVHGLMLENGFGGLSMFELGKIGVFVTLFGIIYIAFAAPFLLPGKRLSKKEFESAKKNYYYNVIIPAGSPFIGKKIVNGHFPEHREIFVTMVEHKGTSNEATSGETKLNAGDKLVIMGGENIMETLISLPGVDIEDYENIDIHFRSRKLMKIEAVVSESSPLTGLSLKEFDFFKYYRGIVAAINRNGEKITTHTGDVVIQSGDCLVIIATPVFLDRWQGSNDFYLLSEKGELEVPQSKLKIWFATGLTIAMILGATLSDKIPALNGTKIDMFFMAALVAMIMFWTKIMSARNYTGVVSWDVLITIACAFGISKGVQNSGLADGIANQMIGLTKDIGPITVMAAIYLLTTIFTEIITNNAAVALMFPIAMSAAIQMNVNAHPFFIAIAIAASASFATPIGYQTNMIVQGIGEYKFKDFLRIGIPLNIIVMIISIFLIPVFWKF
ncbi:MAG: SLC13 family permease [Bacteroidota bacterium]|nr:MAG: SLC13 family permease [Bacteroidota bacterium]